MKINHHVIAQLYPNLCENELIDNYRINLKSREKAVGIPKEKEAAFISLLENLKLN